MSAWVLGIAKTLCFEVWCDRGHILLGLSAELEIRRPIAGTKLIYHAMTSRDSGILLNLEITANQQRHNQHSVPNYIKLRFFIKLF